MGGVDITVHTGVVGSFSGQNGVDDCIEKIAESINYAHSRVEKVVIGFFFDICFYNARALSAREPNLRFY